MNKNVLLTVNYKGAPLEIVKQLIPKEFNLITMESNDHQELVELAGSADYIIASGNLKIDEKVLDSAVNLKMIQRVGVGLDSLDMSELKKRNIPAYVNPGLNANSVAEHALLLILACLRRLTLISNNTKNGIWKKQEQGVTTRELANQTVGIIGFGNIGRRVGDLLKPFGCRIIYYDQRRLSRDEEAARGVEYMSLEDTLKSADVITLHCPLTDDTKELISKKTISSMKPGVIIVNTARGKLINESDLLEALENEKVGFAGLDVFCSEPLNDLKLVSHEHVVCTPHIAGNSFDSFSLMIGSAVKNVKAFDEGRLTEIEKFRIQYD